MSLIIEELVAGRDAFRLGPLTLNAASGERLAVLGRNGSGKTTLLKTLAGLLRPAAGTALIDGVAVAALSDADRARKAAYLPPPGEVVAPYDALTMVRMGRLSLDAEGAGCALAQVGAEHLAHRRFDRLSTGERQLVLLARTLAQGARVCLLDEPTAALDPGRREEVEAGLRALAAEGRVVMVATHDLDLAAGADRILWLEAGRIEEAPAGGAFDAAAWTARYR